MIVEETSARIYSVDPPMKQKKSPLMSRSKMVLPHYCNSLAINLIMVPQEKKCYLKSIIDHNCIDHLFAIKTEKEMLKYYFVANFSSNIIK